MAHELQASGGAAGGPGGRSGGTAARDSSAGASTLGGTAAAGVGSAVEQQADRAAGPGPGSMRAAAAAGGRDPPAAAPAAPAPADAAAHQQSYAWRLRQRLGSAATGERELQGMAAALLAALEFDTTAQVGCPAPSRTLVNVARPAGMPSSTPPPPPSFHEITACHARNCAGKGQSAQAAMCVQRLLYRAAGAYSAHSCPPPSCACPAGVAPWPG
jgi:hypothetical protein